MPRTRLFACVALLAMVAAIVAAAVSRRQAEEPARSSNPTVKLAVLVVFDQLRGDYVERWRDLFGPDGFRRMQDDGAWFADCHYPYGLTTTGPGHASLLTGANPDRHGIINNEWFDRSAGAEVYCAGSDRYDFVPAPPRPKTRPKVGNPDRLLSPTVADVLKRATAGKGKVFGLSLKDRSAIFPAGKTPDGAYWFTGRFVTSTFYRDAVHSWVAEFNDSGAADRWRGMSWERLRSDLDYEKHSGPDAAPGESTGEPLPPAGEKSTAVVSQGVRFPHPMDIGKTKPGDSYTAALVNSPFGNELLLDFARACIVAEKLGRDDVPDLLTVSFSSNDIIGHTWGPDSQEVLDVTLRSDRTVAELLAFLDTWVGKGNYVVAITADHGVCPLPEAAAKRGEDAGRSSNAAMKKGAEAYLRQAFPQHVSGRTGPIEKVVGPWVYLERRRLQADVMPAATAGLAAWLQTQPGVLRAYTRFELAAPDLPDDDAITRRAKQSFHPIRSGDVFVVTKPYHLITDYPTGTTHGAPHAYDTHVPLLVYGPGVPGGKRTEPVTPLHAAAVMAHFLGVDPPRDALYPVPATLFGQ